MTALEKIMVKDSYSAPTEAPIGSPDPGSEITVTVVLRPRIDAHGDIGCVDRLCYRDDHTSPPGELAAVVTYFLMQGFSVEADPDDRQVTLTGTVDAINDVFGVTLREYPYGVDHEGPVYLSRSIHPYVEGVLGLSQRPIAEPHFSGLKLIGDLQAQSASKVPYFTPTQLASIYNFPAADGGGQTIGIIELGGGYIYEDLIAYANMLGYAPPYVTPVPLMGAGNKTGSDADFEVTLDIEVASAVAPKAKIVVYFAPNTTQGLVQAINYAINDKVNKPGILSISWGSPEIVWLGMQTKAMTNVLRDAALKGVSVFAASGDSGSSPSGFTCTMLPAASPYAMSCGGTTLTANGNSIATEVAWSGSGGGVSTTASLPSYQANVNVPKAPGTGRRGRGVPDFAAVADPDTGYLIYCRGEKWQIGGTSAVAPLMAGLFARFNQLAGRNLGFALPQVYGAGQVGFRWVTSGGNGAYQVVPGWNAVTGLGSPNGGLLLSKIR
ncbi:S53 family peptidase [Singulisphaera sp. PoT]|uniref:S53 family peptidase n=1 Tax=Singulisphaera sp. PoT TaxID=3411797 RepID=UPI003BF4D1C1